MEEKRKNGLFDPYSVDIEESEKINEILNYSDVLVQVAKALIDYRTNNNLTQKQLAEKLNMNQSMISKLEKGDYNATLKLLLKISYKLRNDSKLFLNILKNIIYVLEMKEKYQLIQMTEYVIQPFENVYSYNAHKAISNYNITKCNYEIGV